MMEENWPQFPIPLTNRTSLLENTTTKLIYDKQNLPESPLEKYASNLAPLAIY